MATRPTEGIARVKRSALWGEGAQVKRGSGSLQRIKASLRKTKPALALGMRFLRATKELQSHKRDPKREFEWEIKDITDAKGDTTKVLEVQPMPSSVLHGIKKGPREFSALTIEDMHFAVSEGQRILREHLRALVEEYDASKDAEIHAIPRNWL